MMQIQDIEAFARSTAAIAQARIATNRAYDLEMLISSSGTTYEQREPESAKVIELTALVGEYTNDVTASTKSQIMHRGDIPSEVSNTSFVQHSIDSAAKHTGPYAGVGETTELTVALQAVVDHARSHGLQEIADRLVELGQHPLDEDEVPLQATSAMRFVQYCLDRMKQARPLMTVTPAGELDATWRGPEEQSQVMRFFPNGSVG